MKTFVGCVAAVAITLLTLLPANAQTSVESFYKGRTVYIQISFPPGGSYDMYARLASQFMGKYIPGNPTIVIQNKSGGAATLRLFTTNTPTDGSVMGIFPETIGIAQLTDPESSPWDV